MTSSASAPVYTQLGSSSINTASAVSFSPYQINGLSTAKEFHQQQHQYENILTPSMLPAGTVLHQMPNAFATSELPMDASSSAFTTVCLPIVFNSQQYQHQQQQMPESSSAFMSLPMPNTFNGHHHHHNNHHHQHQLPEKATEQPAQQAITTYDLNNSSFQHHQNGGVQLVFQNVSNSPVSTNQDSPSAAPTHHTPLQPETLQTGKLTSTELEQNRCLKPTNRSTTPYLAVKSAPKDQSKTGQTKASKHCSAESSSAQQPNICLLCRLFFADESALLLHNRSHHANLNYLLPILNKTKTLHANHFCQYCAEETTNHDGSGGTTKSFSTASALHAHIQTAHNPTKPHRCLLCKAVAFAKERDLAMHMQRHSGARPHLCSLCDKAFLKRCDLLRHEQVHANRRLFKCQHCDRAFNDKSNLRGHLKRRHPD